MDYKNIMNRQARYLTQTYYYLRPRVVHYNSDIIQRRGIHNLRSIKYDKSKNIFTSVPTTKKRTMEIYSHLDNTKNLSRKKRKRNIVETTTELNTQTFINSDPIVYSHVEHEHRSDVDMGSDPCSDLWDVFNNYDNSYENKCNEWVSATKIRNFLLSDPVLDWYSLYHEKLGFNNNNEKTDINSVLKKKNDRAKENGNLSILFELGNKFEDEVIKYLKKEYAGNIKCVVNSREEINENKMNETLQYMKEGVPIIEQAMLYNYDNKTFGVADILVRSDWVNKIIDSKPMTLSEETIKAPNLNGNYHYIVIDIKWTSLPLCADGYHIRNSGRFAAYKGQLAIYNAVVGQLQGYTPDKAYILAKSWKYIKRKKHYEGYNCFDVLGVIDYSGFDEQFIKKTVDAIQWIRNVRANGHTWKCDPPSVYELYPNMCNSYDSPFHRVKKEHSKKIKELTSLWYVGPKNREIGHSNNIYKYTDPNCNAEALGIKGEKIGPVLNQMININRNGDDNIKIRPRVIANDIKGWQTKVDIEFFVDFESVNTMFYTQRTNMDITNSKSISDMIFLVGIGYEEDNVYKYQKFYLNELTLKDEKRVLDQFHDFIESKIKSHMQKYNIKSRRLCTPKIFHWAPAEITMMQHANIRHLQKWKSWVDNISWVDYCKVFKSEPIVIKGVMGFGLKEIAKKMHEYGMIETSWSESEVSNGLDALIKSAEYYDFMDKYNKADDIVKISKNVEYRKHVKLFSDIIQYNMEDCKVVWEIVNYFRNNHANETFKKLN